MYKVQEPRRGRGQWAGRLLAGCILALGTSVAKADMTVLAEEPINLLGRITSSGHAAVYFDRLCADGYTHLRHCALGERGVVVSRYVGFGGNDWLAVDVLSYLYAVESPNDIPTGSPASSASLRLGWR